MTSLEKAIENLITICLEDSNDWENIYKELDEIRDEIRNKYKKE